MLAEQESDPEKRQQLAIIVDQALRGCEMIADLMQFARPPAWQSGQVELPAIVVELCDRATRSSHMALPELIVDVDAHLPTTTVEADKQALVEAIWAVLRNAVEVARTKVHVRLSSDEQWLQLTILDDGPGLSAKALELAFHPYFSGREAGRGLGLGPQQSASHPIAVRGPCFPSKHKPHWLPSDDIAANQLTLCRHLRSRTAASALGWRGALAVAGVLVCRHLRFENRG